jgi:hypothetical protein
MYLLPDPTYVAQLERRDRDRTLRKTERYELERALREVEEQARARRKAERRARWPRNFGPRTGQRRPIRARIRAAVHRARPARVA